MDTFPIVIILNSRCGHYKLIQKLYIISHQSSTDICNVCVLNFIDKYINNYCKYIYCIKCEIIITSFFIDYNKYM